MSEKRKRSDDSGREGVKRQRTAAAVVDLSVDENAETEVAPLVKYDAFEDFEPPRRWPSSPWSPSWSASDSECSMRDSPSTDGSFVIRTPCPCRKPSDASGYRPICRYANYCKSYADELLEAVKSISD